MDVETSTDTRQPERPDELEAALTAAENLEGAPLTEHVAAFEHLHELLQRRLGETT
ncbi:hypothetical protein [Actinotalea caeni]|uniref:hypothetical protein n=1 Tax=Actinotalea caeni TaxID=1348467 RepID=UPI00195A6CEA|nr:hypothetical protein [Actinotalea caeni]